MNTENKQSGKTVLNVSALTKSFPTSVGKERLEIIRAVDLKLTVGESIAITGPSGSGKSTLLNCIGLLDKPTSGKIEINGSDCSNLTDAEASKLRNREIGFVFQQHHLLPQLTLRENILLPLLAGTGAKITSENEEFADELITRAGLKERADFFSGTLSGGERQRVAVVRALINRPALILADEPTGSLDHARAEEVAELLLEFNSSLKTTLLVVTHSEELAQKMTRRNHLADGSLQASDAESMQA